jgi:hypothetical protein
MSGSGVGSGSAGSRSGPTEPGLDSADTGSAPPEPGPDLPAAGRLYSDEEVEVILRRALAPRATRLAPAGSRDGITLAQLEDVAREAGIDPMRVREAATSLDIAPDTGAGSVVFGPPVSYVFDRQVEGEVPPENLSAVVAAARRLTKSRGSTREVGDWLEWQSDSKIIHLSVKPEDGRTSVQLMADGGFRAVGIWGATALATLLTIVGIGAETAGISLLEILGIAGGGFTLARTTWEIVGRRARARYTALAERLTNEISALTARRSFPPSPGSTTDEEPPRLGAMGRDRPE